MEPLPFDWQQYLILPQIVGFIAFATEVWALSQKSDERFLNRQLVVAVAWVLHFGLMQSWTGCLIAAVNMMRYIIVLHFMPNLRWKPYVATGVIASGLLVTLCFSNAWMDWTPWIASIVATLAIFYSRGVLLRFAFLFVSACWLIYAAFVGSIGGMMAEAVLITTNILTITHLLRHKSPMPPLSQE